jgi:DNA-binding transcriptional MerR regulator
MGMRIGELSKQSGVKVGTIRFYERRKLSKSPPRTSSGYRSYVPQDVQVVKGIKQLQELGFTLREVKELIDLHRCAATLSNDRAEARGVQRMIALMKEKLHDRNEKSTSPADAQRRCQNAGRPSDIGREGMPCCSWTGTGTIRPVLTHFFGAGLIVQETAVKVLALSCQRHFRWKCAHCSIANVTFMILVGGIGALQFNLSALGEPNRTETYLATLAKYFLVRRASRAAMPPPPADLQASIAEADKLYGTKCAGHVTG